MKQFIRNKFFAGFIKFGLAVGLIAWLVLQASKKPEFGQILREPKDARLIGLAFLILFVGVVGTFLRWRVTQGVPGLRG